MLQLGQQIRLTRREVARFTRLTDIAPAGVRTVQDLDAYVARCKAYYWGVSAETRLLHALVDEEYQHCRRAS